MHRCLKLPEIVDMICAALDPRCSSEWPVLSFRDLAIVARTCTSFRDPALDHLWSKAALSQILMRCMPSDLWAKDMDEIPLPWWKRHQVRLLRPVRVSDWDRVQFYTPRVKILWSGSDHWSLSSVFPALSASLPDGLFPSLQTLSWHHSEDEFHYIHLFLRRTLTSISLVASSDANSSIFSTLATKCPKLTDISVSDGTVADYDNSSVSEFVRSLQCVQKINVPSLDQKALEHISHLMTLNSLRLSSLPEGLTLTPIDQRPAFTALRQLTLTHPDIGPTTKFLRWCSGIPLDGLHVSIWEFVTEGQMDDLLAAISAGFLHASLTNLSVDSNCDDPEGSDPNIHRISLHSLQHIFGFVNLTNLSITSLVGFDLDNEAMADLARAWPRIVTLTLAILFHGPTPRATLSCLHSFAQHCPRLRSLTIALNALVVPTPEADPSTRFVQHTLKTLDVEHSPTGKPFYTARFLSGVFPKLTKIETSREYHDNDEEDNPDNVDQIRLHWRWKEVESLLPEISALREEGRMLAQPPSTA
ncbi:hypothetical protein K438DRAFT_1798253 [Mycena galopus ATCC 62051]|nr:hypothetical protein K438DRAFT_1798253 [Mycena galopus ATCC 62051]